jgi:hypothetical protein
MFLANVATTVAAGPEATISTDEVPSLAVVATQTSQLASMVSTEAGRSTAGMTANTGAAPTIQASSTASVGSVAISPQKSALGPPTPGVASDPTMVLQHAPDGALEVQSAPPQATSASPAATSAPIVVSPTPPTPGAGIALNPAQVPTSSAATIEASAAAIMLERQRRAQTITTAWPAAAAREQPQAAAPASELQSMISQFESLARDTPTGTAAPTGAELALARAQEMTLVSVISSASPLPAAAAGPRLVLGSAQPDASTTVAAADRSLPDISPARSDRFGAVRPTSPGIPAESTALPTGVPLSSLAGGTLGGGAATGLAAPAAALLVVAAACLLATRSQGRLNMDPLPWRSVLLSSRLERPG